MRGWTDPQLPGLAFALDVEGFLDALRRDLEKCGEELELVDGQILDVQYSPGRKGLIVYRLELHERATDRSVRQVVSVHALARGETPRPPTRSAARRYRALEGFALQTPYVHLREAQLAVYAFPVDPSLKRLLDAFDPMKVRVALQQLWHDRGVRVRRVTARPLAYAPEARAALRYEVLCEARNTGIPELRHLVGKIHASKPASKLFASAWALWRAAKMHLPLAPPVGYLPRLNMTLQEEVEGVRLGDLAGLPNFVKPVRQTARSIAVLHGLSLPLNAKRRPGSEADVVRRWGGLLAALRPDLATRVEGLCGRLVTRLGERTRVKATVHGDFHPANVLAGEDHVTLIDFDQMAEGDPLLDVGRFLASLRVSALRVAGDPSALSRAGESFLEQYLAQSPEDESRVRLFEAACLLTAATTGFRLQRRGWREHAGRLLDEAERVFERAQSGAPVAVPAAPEERPERPGAEARWAEDPVYVRALLDSYIRTEYSAELTACRVISRAETERSRRLRFRLSGRKGHRKWSATLEGVAQRRGGGRGSFERLASVRRALDGEPDTPLLSRPLAYLPQLKLQVLEEPQGMDFASLAGTSEASGVVAAVARALLVLHGTAVELDRERALAVEMRDIERRLAELRARTPDLHRLAAPTWLEAERRLRAAAPRLAPVLRRLPLDAVLWCEGRIAFSRVEDIALSHPLLDAAEFLARLGTLGLESGGGEAAEALARRFRDTYLARAAASASELAAFEAMALLRAGCWTARVASRRHAAESLVSLATAVLAG